MAKFLFIILIITPIFAQEGITVIDERTDQKMLLGRHDRSAFWDSSFVEWFNEEYDFYKLDGHSISFLRNKIDTIKTTIVMGTWCSDSRREVPHFYKIADSLGYDESNIELICVDHAKVGIDDEVDGLDIVLVPTFIFYSEKGVELGRIIETPLKSLEEDLSDILNK